MKSKQMKLTELKDLMKTKAQVTPRYSAELCLDEESGELRIKEVER